MAPEITHDEVRRLAERAGVPMPEEDLAPVAAALAAHAALVRPLLERDLSQESPALAFDPRWHDRR